MSSSPSSSTSSSLLAGNEFLIDRHVNPEFARRKRENQSEERRSVSSCVVVGEKLPAVVAKRNARERTRVHTVNQAFLILKQHLPTLRQHTKRVSKLKILNAAINYIDALVQIIQNSDSPSPPKTLSKLRMPPIGQTTSDTSLVDTRLLHHLPQQLAPLQPPPMPPGSIGSSSSLLQPFPTQSLPYMKGLLDYPAYLYQPAPQSFLVNNHFIMPYQ